MQADAPEWNWKTVRYLETIERMDALSKAHMLVSRYKGPKKHIQMGAASCYPRSTSWYWMGRATVVRPNCVSLKKMCMWVVNEIVCHTLADSTHLKSDIQYRRFLEELQCPVADHTVFSCLPSDVVDKMCKDRRFSFHSPFDTQLYNHVNASPAFYNYEQRNAVCDLFTCSNCLAGRWNSANECRPSTVTVEEYRSYGTASEWIAVHPNMSRDFNARLDGREYDGALFLVRYNVRVCNTKCEEALREKASKSMPPLVWTKKTLPTPLYAVKKLRLWAPKRPAEVPSVDPDDIDSEVAEPSPKKRKPSYLIDSDDDGDREKYPSEEEMDMDSDLEADEELSDSKE